VNPKWGIKKGTSIANGLRPAKVAPRGFSLVEVLIAAALISVAFLAIASMFPTGYTNVVYGGNASRGLALAQQKVEELRNSSFPPSSGSDSPSGFTRTWTVDSITYGSPPVTGDVVRVTVTVTWPQVVRPGNIQLVAFIAKPY